MSPPSWISCPPHLPPLKVVMGHQAELPLPSQLPTGYLCHMWQCIYVSATLSIDSNLSFPNCDHKIVLYVCVSVPALQIGSSVPKRPWKDQLTS